MKAFRNVAGTIVEIDVDIDLNGQPILPPDTTVDEKPAAQDGHYVTVVGNAWVQIPITQEFVSFEYRKQQHLNALKRYKAWYLEQPVEHNGITYDADEQARIRLTQALIVYNAISYLPPFWIDANNNQQPLTSIDDLKAIITTVQTAFTNRFYEINTIRQAILNASDEAALALIDIPTIPNHMHI